VYPNVSGVPTKSGVDTYDRGGTKVTKVQSAPEQVMVSILNLFKRITLQ
jgi:hypothetical protein